MATGVKTAASRADGVVKVYGKDVTEVRALDEISVDFAPATFTAIMGPSGSGKSSLLHCLAGLDRVTSGRVMLGDIEVSGLDEKGLTQLRRDKVGFIFQGFNLVPTLTALENITLPMALAGRKADKEWLDAVVATVGLGSRLHHRPNELSGGEQQRVAAARAMLSRPEVVFADEPTGNLDSRSGAQLLEFLEQAVSEFDQTIVMVTHDPIAASHAGRVVFMADGKVVDEMAAPTARKVLDRMKRLEA
ncbi:MAG TPA: ABC transporter ATP-binding protein [Acidimicrobiales bacterium]|nr:ABC transporter ATP-binding protein [Acidimicrobiales bacterium]